MQENNSEFLVATANGGMAIYLPSYMSEETPTKGIYTVACTGPRPQDMDRYARVRDAINELEGRGRASRFWNRKTISTLQAKMNDIEIVPFWNDVAHNQVCNLGKNELLDKGLAGSGYTVVGPYMGLITTTSFTAYAVGDTMASHAGWLEAGAANAPAYSGTRKTMVWSAASGGVKSLSAALSFAITSGGTLQGCFAVYGSAAVNTIDSTLGILFSAGSFSGGTQPVVNTNTVAVSYSITI